MLNGLNSSGKTLAELGLVIKLRAGTVCSRALTGPKLPGMLRPGTTCSSPVNINDVGLGDGNSLAIIYGGTIWKLATRRKIVIRKVAFAVCWLGIRERWHTRWRNLGQFPERFLLPETNTCQLWECDRPTAISIALRHEVTLNL